MPSVTFSRRTIYLLELVTYGSAVQGKNDIMVPTCPKITGYPLLKSIMISGSLLAALMIVRVQDDDVVFEMVSLLANAVELLLLLVPSRSIAVWSPLCLNMDTNNELSCIYLCHM
jgi:hypothetical protein